MKKMTCLSAITCVSWLSCNNEPENPKNKTTGENPVVEELCDKIKAFKHVDNNNLFEFIQIIEDFEKNGGEKVTVEKATIQDNELTFEILGIKGTMNLMLNEKVFDKQKQFDHNIRAIQWLNDRGGELAFPLNINTFPLEYIVFFDYFGPNLDKIKKINGNNHNKKFSIEKGVVQLEGEVFLPLDSLAAFQALAGALRSQNRHCFFDDTFFQNPITWKSNDVISFYGGKNCVFFEKGAARNYVSALERLLNALVSMKRVQIPIDKIKIEQTSNSIKLGGYPLDEDIWTDYNFWNILRPYHELFNFGDGIRIKEENDGFIINNKPIKIVQHLIKNVKHHKEDFISKQIFKLERAN